MSGKVKVRKASRYPAGTTKAVANKQIHHDHTVSSFLSPQKHLDKGNAKGSACMMLPLLPASANAGLEDKRVSCCRIPSLVSHCFASVDLLVSAPFPMPPAHTLAGWKILFGSTDLSLKQESNVHCLYRLAKSLATVLSLL